MRKGNIGVAPEGLPFLFLLALTALAFGASLISIFARLGGGEIVLRKSSLAGRGGKAFEFGSRLGRGGIGLAGLGGDVTQPGFKIRQSAFGARGIGAKDHRNVECGAGHLSPLFITSRAAPSISCRSANSASGSAHLRRRSTTSTAP